MVYGIQQSLQHGKTAKTPAKAHRHKATGRRYSGRPVGIVGSANSNRSHHSAVAKHKIRLIGIKILRNTHIVGACLHIIRRHYVGIRKFRIIQIKIAVDHGNHHVGRAARLVPGPESIYRTEVPGLTAVCQKRVVGRCTHVHHSFVEHHERYVGNLQRKLRYQLHATLRRHLYGHQLGIRVGKQHLVAIFRI